MIPVLACVVEDPCKVVFTFAEGDDLFERFMLKIGVFFDETIKSRYIGQMVLVVMKFQRFRTHTSLGKSGMDIGQSGQFESHKFTP